MKALIVDYGMGNIASVKKSLDFIGIDCIISNLEKDFEDCDFIILPGVGSFKQGMENLNKLNLVSILNNEVIVKKKPFLGICLGMQLIAQIGTEHGLSDGLGWIEGSVIKIQSDVLRIPHLGWNNLIVENDPLLKPFNAKDFYFIHSYHFDVSNCENIAATVNYGKNYVAAVRKDNIFATQFHPEKSQDQGIKLLKLFFNKNA